MPRVRKDGVLLHGGQLLSAPFETEELTQTYEIELPYDPSDRLLYYFSSVPFLDEPPTTPLNLTHDVFSVPNLARISKKCDLTLRIKRDGMIQASFTFRGKGGQFNKKGEVVVCPEFYFEGFQIIEGKPYIGLDFGNSNSYLVRFISRPNEVSAAQYPEFTLRPKAKERLRKLELKLEQARSLGALNKSRVLKHAQDQMLEIIFHSNKIEGNQLTKGETEHLLSSHGKALTESELEAKNLESAYRWMLDNVQSCITAPEMFIRHINGMILQRIATHGGEYRKGPVKLSGMNFTPPTAGSVPAFMAEFADEVKAGSVGRSVLECAVTLHTKLVWIHPFNDGNGRTARLLLNAYLLSQDLPVIVVNYADKERYLQCLSESNKGDLSPLLEFMIECFEQQFEELLAPVDSPEVSAESENVTVAAVGSPAQAVKVDPIATVLAEAGVAEVDDPLTMIMKTKVVERQKTIEAEYQAWKQSFLTVPAEFRAIIESFNANHAYDAAGYHMRCQTYDFLTLDKYVEIVQGKTVSKTWFVGLEIFGPGAREKLLCFFSGASRLLRQDIKASGVAVLISRYDGSRYNRLSSEPIGLREIGYREGELIFVSKDRKIEQGNARTILQAFLADAIKSYL